MFHLMPYRDLPADFDQRYNSAYIDPVWFDVADPDKVGQYYNATLDEMLFAAKAGLHGLCTNQHHQNVYGFMANPSIMGAVLAKATNGQNIAIIQLGSTLPSTTPPTRIAEEYAMLDCISGGRLVAGFPTGLPTDATISNGVVPVEQRERYREALALVIKAWSAKEIFAWNGRHYQLGMVNLWPRPIQQPHPPIWIPGAGISSTAEYVVEPGSLLLPSELLRRQERGAGQRPLLGTCRAQGARRQSVPVQLPAAHRGRRDRCRGRGSMRPHAEYFFHKLLYTPPYYQAIPGCLEYGAHGAGVGRTIRAPDQSARAQGQGFLRARISSWSEARRPCASS